MNNNSNPSTTRDLFRTPARSGKVLEMIRAAEHLDMESDVQFPLSQMYSFAGLMRSTDNMIENSLDSGYHIYSVHFDSLSPTENNYPGMFAVRMHCGCKRFEEFVDRYQATIVDMSIHSDLIHVVAQAKNSIIGWFEVTTVYYRKDLRRTEESVFEDIDSMHDLFMIHTIFKDWKIAEGLTYSECTEE